MMAHPLDALQAVAVGAVVAFNPAGPGGITRSIIAVAAVLAFLIGLWIPIQDPTLKSILIGALGVILGAYFNEQGHSAQRQP